MSISAYRAFNNDGYVSYQRITPESATLKVVYRKTEELFRAVNGNAKQVLQEMMNEEHGALKNCVDGFFNEILDRMSRPEELEWEVDMPAQLDASQMRYKMPTDGSLIRVPFTVISHRHQLVTHASMEDAEMVAAQQEAYQQWTLRQIQRKYSMIYRSYCRLMGKS